MKCGNGAFPELRDNKKGALIFGGRSRVTVALPLVLWRFHTCRTDGWTDYTCLSPSHLSLSASLPAMFHQVEDLCTQMDGRPDRHSLAVPLVIEERYSK